MNERIKELVKQATVHIPPVPDVSGEGWIFDKEKFAELIVQEAIDIAYANGDNVDYLKKHFGVKA